ncbi:MAG: hypothetical protein ACO1SX_13750 [Actinomycetota bacterium]
MELRPGRRGSLEYWGLPVLVALIFIAHYLGCVAADLGRIARAAERLASPAKATGATSPPRAAVAGDR